ncbi:hypothetical protein OG250_39045 [Streptomyces sp. NBC_00487]|uniref:hypothetical protein n=1 Tax=unclassified Streptomyces TaxID=2593676 RepID=UPI002E196ABF|nr:MULTISPECIES: hypothetical protein [unclassified Streptomyces]
MFGGEAAVGSDICGMWVSRVPECHVVRAQQAAEVVVGDACEQCRGDSEAAETGDDVEA